MTTHMMNIALRDT